MKISVLLFLALFMLNVCAIRSTRPHRNLIPVHKVPHRSMQAAVEFDSSNYSEWDNYSEEQRETIKQDFLKNQGQALEAIEIVEEQTGEIIEEPVQVEENVTDIPTEEQSELRINPNAYQTYVPPTVRPAPNQAVRTQTGPGVPTPPQQRVPQIAQRPRIAPVQRPGYAPIQRPGNAPVQRP